ncbi:MAG: hypothetical protein ACOVOR_00520 [Rhabdochlamydiaceae bacterium]
MNIIPLVIAFIIVFNFLSSQLIWQKIDLYQIESHYLSYMKTSRQLKNKMEDKLYQKFEKVQLKTKAEGKGNSPPNKNSPHDVTKKNKVRKDRWQTHPSVKTRLNLIPLLHQHKNSLNFFKNYWIHLMNDLYGHELFFKEASSAFHEDVMKEIERLFKEQMGDFKLSDIRLSNKEWQLIWFKILKGTNHYDLKQKKGYPPLEDFIVFRSDDPHLIYFGYASVPVLNTLFGSDMLKQILNMEENKGNLPLSKQEFQDLCHKQPPIWQKKYQDLSNLISFSRPNYVDDAIYQKSEDGHHLWVKNR